jgi:ferredoxin
MPKLEIEGHGTFEVEAGTRLVLAIEGCGVDIGHRCGGYARCTTCRVEIAGGGPARMTVAERDKLAERDLLGSVRLSCQCTAEGDMKVRPLMLVSEQGWSDPGPAPEPVITPPPEWVERPGA